MAVNTTFDSSAGQPLQSESVTVGRRQRHRADIADRICRAGLELFATRGIEATRIADITEAADIGKGTFFNYFSSKGDLMAHFVERNCAILEDAIAQARDGHKPVRNVVRDMLSVIFEGPHASAMLARSCLSALLSDEQACGVMLEFAARMREGWSQFVAIGQQRGEIRADRPAAELARLFHESANGACMFWALRPTGAWRDELLACFDRFWSALALQAPDDRGAPRPRGVLRRRVKR